MTIIAFPPPTAVEVAEFHELAWRYELPKPTAGPALRRWQIEEQLTALLAGQPYVEAVRFFAGMNALTWGVTGELVEALVEAADAVLAAEAEGSRQTFYNAVDDYADALHVIERATRTAAAS